MGRGTTVIQVGSEKNALFGELLGWSGRNPPGHCNVQGRCPGSRKVRHQPNRLIDGQAGRAGFLQCHTLGGGEKTSAGGALSSGYSPPRRPTYRSIAPARTQQDRETEEQTPKHGTPSWFYFWADIQNPGAGSKTWLATRLFGHCQVQGPHQVSWKGGILIHSPPSQPKCQLFWQHKDFL